MMFGARILWKALFLMAMMFGVAASFGQSSDATYRLQVEDVLYLQIYGEGQVQAQIPVGQDGNITAPFVGVVKAAGRTTDELAVDLTKLYIEKLRLRDPKVSVTILKFRELLASVVGPVTRPGSHLIRKGETVVTLLAKAGGLVDEKADPYRATLRRANSKEQIPIDLFALLYRGDTSQNYEIQDGDELLIPIDSKNHVNVLGAIQRPFAYPYRDGMTVNDAIALSGGEIPGLSMMSNIWVMRPVAGEQDKFRILKSDLVRFYTKQDYSQNLALYPGDIVYVNKTKTPLRGNFSELVNTVWFTQQIARSGFLGFKPF